MLKILKRQLSIALTDVFALNGRNWKKFFFCFSQFSFLYWGSGFFMLANYFSELLTMDVFPSIGRLILGLSMQWASYAGTSLCLLVLNRKTILATYMSVMLAGVSTYMNNEQRSELFNQSIVKYSITIRNKSSNFWRQKTEPVICLQALICSTKTNV